MSTQPEDTLAMPVVAETLPALPAVTETAPEPEPERPWHHYPIGDWLISSLPGFDTLPCGHCGAVFGGATPGVLTEVRVLGRLRHLAYEAGWEYDLGLMWTCPQCRQDAAQAAGSTGPNAVPGVFETVFTLTAIPKAALFAGNDLLMIDIPNTGGLIGWLQQPYQPDTLSDSPLQRYIQFLYTVDGIPGTGSLDAWLDVL